MNLSEAILQRHSVRAFKDTPLDEGTTLMLETKITELNAQGNLHIQLIRNEPKAFSGVLAKYGHFRNVNNYFVIAGKTAEDLDERCGYFGEQLVLYAQTLGLNTCWVGLSYSKIPGTYTLNKDEKIVCYIALGYGETQGKPHKIKRIEQVSNIGKCDTPEWFRKGVEAALLAPTAINQQKFYFEYIPGDADHEPSIHAKAGFSLVGYTKLDLGIAKCHFDIVNP